MKLIINFIFQLVKACAHEIVTSVMSSQSHAFKTMIHFLWESQCENKKIEQYEEFKHIYTARSWNDLSIKD